MFIGYCCMFLLYLLSFYWNYGDNVWFMIINPIHFYVIFGSVTVASVYRVDQ